jgi:hypothetical protein
LQAGNKTGKTNVALSTLSAIVGKGGRKLPRLKAKEAQSSPKPER